MSSAATPVKNIPGIAKAIPGSDENHSPSRRNHCSHSARNPFRLHPGIVFAITPESLFALPRNPHTRPSHDPDEDYETPPPSMPRTPPAPVEEKNPSEPS